MTASGHRINAFDRQQSLHCCHCLTDAEWLQRGGTKRLGFFMLLKTVSDASMNETGHFMLTNCKGPSELVRAGIPA